MLLRPDLVLQCGEPRHDLGREEVLGVVVRHADGAEVREVPAGALGEVVRRHAVEVVVAARWIPKETKLVTDSRIKLKK